MKWVLFEIDFDIVDVFGVTFMNIIGPEFPFRLNKGKPEPFRKQNFRQLVMMMIPDYPFKVVTFFFFFLFMVVDKVLGVFVLQ